MAKKTAKNAKKKKSSHARKAARTPRKTAKQKTTAARKKPRAAAKARPGRPAAKRKGSTKASATATRKPAATRKGSSAKARAGAAGRKDATGRQGAAKSKGGRKGGSGRERTLAQTPETGRTVKGRTNPMPTKRSTGTPAGAGTTRRAPALDRQRRRLRELEEELPAPPSTLDLDRMASAARTGRAEMREARREHTESSPALTAGDVDADWEGAYATGDEAPGGDNPTPDQDRVDDIGKALGVTYEDNEELKASDKIAERDKHRWELDPASSEDYRNRDKDLDEE